MNKKLIILLAVLIWISGCNHDVLRHEINAFINSSGSDDFDVNLLSEISKDAFNEKAEVFYKAGILSNGHIDISNNDLIKIIKVANKDFNKISLFNDFGRIASIYGLNNFNKGLKSSLQIDVNRIKSRIKQHENNNNYESFTKIIPDIRKLKTENYVIDFSVDALNIISNGIINNRYSQGFRRWWNFPHGVYSANVLNDSTAISFGYINPEKSKNINSKLITIRANDFIPWNNYSTQGFILNSSIGWLSDNNNGYLIHYSDLSSNINLSNYITNNKLPYSFTDNNNNTNIDAYLSVGLSESTEACNKVISYIRKGIDLIIHHPSGDIPAGSCMGDIVSEYFSLTLAGGNNFSSTYSEFVINTVKPPYTYNPQNSENDAIALPTSPVMGSTQPLELPSFTSINNVEHVSLKTFFQAFDDSPGISELLISLEKTYKNGDSEKYYSILIEINNIIEINIIGNNYTMSELILSDRLTISLVGGTFPLSMYEYTLDGGATFNNLTNGRFTINNQNYHENEIGIRLKSKYAKYLKYLDEYDNFTIYYDGVFYYDETIVPDFNPENIVYTSIDGFHQLHTGRLDGRGVDIVITGDGFLSRDQSQFRKYATDVISSFMSYDTILPHLGMYNFHSTFFPSNERGADYSIESGCSFHSYDNCNSANYSKEKNDKDTVFDSGFYNRGTSMHIARLLTSDNNIVTRMVNKYVPQFDELTVIVNTNVYGGSGGFVAVSYKNNNHVFVHEVAHSFAGLFDEYQNRNICGKNVCPSFDNISWKHHLPVNASIDTVCQDAGNCKTGTPGWFDSYKPTDKSIMSTNGLPFYAVNAEFWLVALYKSTGFFYIDSPNKVNFGIQESILSFSNQEDQKFTFTPTNEMSHNVNKKTSRVQEFKWFINGIYKKEFDNLKSINYGKIEKLTYEIKLKATDVSGILVKHELVSELSTFTWTVKNNSTGDRNSDIQKSNSSLKLTLGFDDGNIFEIGRLSIKKHISINSCNTDLYDGPYLKMVSATGVEFIFCEINASYYHDKNQLRKINTKYAKEKTIFSVSIPKYMNNGRYTFYYKNKMQPSYTKSDFELNIK